LGEANLECQLCIEDHMFTQLSVLWKNTTEALEIIVTNWFIFWSD
jgi:hypothetical protein